ncbi:MAG: hypothetical protein LBG77_06495, partial [Dysgonamonadaceae bacterium]|nr:hypothetical protein [Dysgonamonadaceae bacterium]
MNKLKKTSFLLAVIFGCLSCSSAESVEDSNVIEGITFANYPRVDGSTSTKPLNAMVACKLLNIRYE